MDNSANISANTKPRHAEYTDTHQSVHRQDPDWNRKKQNNHEQNNDDPSSDSADISIEAIILLLKGMLEQKSGHDKSNKSIAKEASMRLSALSKPYTNHANYASNAYQHAAQITPDERKRRAAKSYARNRIEQTLSTCLALKSQAITSITIEKNGDFLASIENAAIKTLNG